MVQRCSRDIRNGTSCPQGSSGVDTRHSGLGPERGPGTAGGYSRGSREPALAGGLRRAATGQGTAGTGGFVPPLSPPPVPLKPGAATSISASGILGGAPTLLALGTAPQSVQIAGIDLLVDEPAFFTVAPPGTPWVPGDGAFDLHRHRAAGARSVPVVTRV